MEKLILLENLLQRFEYNERTKLYAIKGPVTNEEYSALITATKAYRRSLHKEGA